MKPPKNEGMSTRSMKVGYQKTGFTHQPKLQTRKFSYNGGWITAKEISSHTGYPVQYVFVLIKKPDMTIEKLMDMRNDKVKQGFKKGNRLRLMRRF